MGQLTTNQVCSFLNITNKTLYNYIDDNKLRVIKKENNQNYFDKFEILRMQPTVINIYNHKGGVGKSALALIIAEYFEYKKNLNKILLCDFDAQANLTKHFIKHEDLYDDKHKIYSVGDYFTRHKKLQDIIYNIPNHEMIDILPAKLNMADTKDIDSMILKTDHSKDFYDIFKKYNLIIIDCPPAINMYSKFGLILANYILAPVLLDPESMWGIDAVLKLIKTFQTFENYIDYKVIINQKERAAAVREGIKSAFVEQLKNNLFSHVVPEFVGFVERGLTGSNIFESAPDKEPKNKLIAVLEELEEWIYEQRTIKEQE